MSDFLVRGTLADLDPIVHNVNKLEAARQFHKIILIASESTAPIAVRETLNSAFNNVYAEGYPDEISRAMTEADIVNYARRLGHYRRYSNPRYYKGVEYCDTVEALARRRGAELFANEHVSAEDIYLNLQALSGGPANNAVYHGLLDPGDTVMGMKLTDGGHLSHGSPVNRSGKYYNSIPYSVDPKTEKIDYEKLHILATKHKPKLIIAGYSSYPWAVDWGKFREIADSVGAFLMADIAHVAGLVAAGQYPSPVGIADVVTFTTHKSMCGPRGACILTTDRMLARKIDRAVFPGEQGGPHLNTIAAIAVAFKIARSDQFKLLQKQIRDNASRMAARFTKLGFRVPFGGTDTHLVNLDCKSIVGPDGTPLMGDTASRILDLANIVVNRNTIPGDQSALNPSGLRLGTVWISQRGFREADVDAVTDLISELLLSVQPYSYPKRHGINAYRAKVDFHTLNDIKVKARNLSHRMGIDYTPDKYRYPHFYYIDQEPPQAEHVTLEISGNKAAQFLQTITSNDVTILDVGQCQDTQITQEDNSVMCALTRTAEAIFQLCVPGSESVWIKTWLRDLSDGYIHLGSDDLHAKVPGAVSIVDLGVSPNPPKITGEIVQVSKPYFVGISSRTEPSEESLPDFNFSVSEPKSLMKTELYGTHQSLGAKMVPFGGWDMPVWYSSVSEEHNAVRSTAGLFDVSHMGVWEAKGPTAAEFLDIICANDINSLSVGSSLYTHFLDPDGLVIDDLLVYRRQKEYYLVVVNASNDKKDWEWVNAVQAGKVLINRDRPWSKASGRSKVTLRNLRDKSSGKDMRVDVALQGPNSKKVLLALGADDATHCLIDGLKRTKLCDAKLGKFDLIVSRTGYTGEPLGYELFVHPSKIVDLWNTMINVGEPYGLLPCGLAARDSTRTEAGLPLYGHEMSGNLNLSVSEAGFGSYVKTYKPWFIGRKTFMDYSDRGTIVRFRFNHKGVRMAHYGDPVVDKRGRVIGQVTSCAIDSEGFLLGQAFVNSKYSTPGTNIGIFQSASDKPQIPHASLSSGDQVRLHESAMILSRFMRKK
jgi:glycine hydroxymethyltransferase